jgi:Holliday junction resolvasome RuvABC endonuclease subunit
MVMKILNLKEALGTMDVSDALAVGICCLNQARIK